MRLYEFADNGETSPLKIQIVSILKHLQAVSTDNAAKKPLSVESVLNILEENGVSISEDTFREMVKNGVFSGVINPEGIKNNQVFFKNQTGDFDVDNTDADEQQDTIERMAKKASKKPQL